MIKLKLFHNLTPKQFNIRERAEVQGRKGRRRRGREGRTKRRKGRRERERKTLEGEKS